jgi:hypothetical protein
MHGQKAPFTSDANSTQKVSDKETFKVSWTIADIFNRTSPLLGLTYHCMGTSFDMLTPVGVVMGSAYGLATQQPSLLLSMANGGLYAGVSGMGLGLLAMGGIAMSGEAAKPPFNKDGIQDRCDRLQKNYVVRTMDRSVWLGLAIGAVGLLAKGSPLGLGLAPGALGVLQGLSLGAAMGSSFGLLDAMRFRKAEQKARKENE